MSLTLQPQASFTVVRQIANHTDSSTYFVRAVIRDAYTDELLANLDLTDRGSQRFSKNWQVPADVSGQGHYVSIVTSVYTDSGYTTKSENYGDEENTYLVQDRSGWSHGRGGGSLGISDIRRVIREELGKIEKPEGVDYDRLKPSPVNDRTEEVLKAIRENKPEKTAPVDLAPVLEAVSAVKQAVEAKEVTPPTDLTPLLEKLQEKNETDGLDFSEVKEKLDAIEPALVAAVEGTVKKAIEETSFVSTFRTEAQPRKSAQEQQPAETIDMKKLAL
jgi:hypothetical protein